MPFVNITTNATTVVRSDGPSRLNRVIINTKGATANTMKLYDGPVANAKLIGTIDTTTTVGSIDYNLNLSSGLVVVTATGTASDATVVYDEALIG